MSPVIANLTRRRCAWVILVALWGLSGCQEEPGPRAQLLADSASPHDATSLDTPGLDSNPELVDTTASLSDAVWTVLHSELDEALLSLWGSSSSDLWAVGADQGSGPVVLHGTPSGWTRLLTGTTGDLWWVYGPSDDEIVMVGSHGTVLRYDRTSETLRALESGTDATLFGVWGTPERLWAVGGHLPPHDGPPVLLQIEGETVTHVALPEAVPDDLMFFKVWGAGPDDVTVIGEDGALLHWDGVTWTWSPLEGSPRLVTVHGSDSGERVLVGGANNAALFEEHDGSWTDSSPPFAPALNGVFVHPARSAAVGMLGAVFLKEEGAWFDAPPLPLFVDLHGTWIDESGDVYTVGGGLLSATAMDRGALLRWGPVREGGLSAPSGPIPEKSLSTGPVTPKADAEPEPEDVDAIEDSTPPQDIGPLEDMGPVEDAPVETDSSEDMATQPLDSADDSADDGSIGPEEIAPEGDADATDPGGEDISVDADGDTADSSEGPVEPDTTEPPGSLSVSLGEVTPELAFTQLESGQNLEIVQGPQGGVHVEVGVRVQLPAGLTTTLATLDASSFIEGELVGEMLLGDYGLYETDDGYVSWPIPVIFFTNLADPYVGSELQIDIEVILEDGTSGTGSAAVLLVDWY